MLAGMSAVVVLALCLSLAMAVGWRIALRTGNSGWIDVTWSAAIGLAGALACLTVAGLPARRGLVLFLIAGWSLRLALHIGRRAAKGKDDPRYVQLRQEWGQGWKGRLFWFLQIQAAAGLVLVLAARAAAAAPGPMGWREVAGLALVIAAVLGEGLADRQLRRFAADPANAGRVCDRGLWRFSRHPNYFFEWLCWLAYPLIAIAPGHPWGWLALAAPAMMYVLLVHVSGIPPLEAHMLRSRGAAFRNYQQRVNGFWPGPERSAA